MNDPQSVSCLEVNQDKAFEDLEEIPEERKHQGRSPLHSFNAHNVQKITGTEKLATE